MAKITPNFNFSGNCYEAIQLYQRAFDARIHTLIRNRDAVWDEATAKMTEAEKELVYHAEVFIGEARIMMSDNPDLPLQPVLALSLTVTMDTKEEVMRAFEVMQDGGNIIYPPQATAYSSCFVSLTDRFGFRWVIMTEQTEK
ncbi:MAG: VOC family protein [Clostridiales bacterium]|nr:VOC family protein [Clostridiales bacterium]